ncbi:MHYT domain-containing protein, NO-binding membrane sensor [Rhizobiales bacterium GAS191]|jgi:NO-binding membrane sensor protein with MHYT domain|nr:MHYT domain-containing protein, NO-binding membrane sensor [Rhizobiales bacterium GAS113]SEC36593.1 MHYT domain-containing protein, NO-binding membrane sensor [Rhizobiales bacterium GAS188]SEC90801.1 MHYT domain-containing protein, NO-binding membrane sensor [Rhizobiales bacterium GAS191]
MRVTHEPWLVILSLVVAIQGAYVGLNLAVQVRQAEGLRRRLLLAGAAISLAVAIWAMHFVGMLAARLPFTVDYLVFPTLLSFLVCVIVVGTAVFAASAGPLTMIRLAASACVMGGGIATMHYIGMSALHASAHMVHEAPFVVASVLVGIAASGLALWLASDRGGRPPLLLSATALGLAIAGMHYTAMAGLTIYPFGQPTSGAPALSTDLLAIVVAIVAFLGSAIFLLALVPDRAAAPARLDVPAAQLVTVPAQPAEPPAAPVAVVAAVPGNRSDEAGPEFGRGTFGPLGGAGNPPRRLARQLPVERDGATYFVPIDTIVAIHANAHYTFISDGAATLFCPLSIGEIEQRLDAEHFVRVHRSHIVNLDCVVGLKRVGDNGLVELSGAEHQTVPVSRSRFGRLKSRLGLINREATLALRA